MATDDTIEPVIQYSKGDLLAYGITNQAVNTTIAGAKIIVQSISISCEGESKTYKDNTGTTCALVIPETYQTLSIEGLMFASEKPNPPKKGDKVEDLPLVAGMLTETGITWRVESCNINWSNEDVTKVSLTVRSYNF